MVEFIARKGGGAAEHALGFLSRKKVSALRRKVFSSLASPRPMMCRALSAAQGCARGGGAGFFGPWRPLHEIFNAHLILHLLLSAKQEV